MAASVRLSEGNGRLWERSPVLDRFRPFLLLQPGAKSRFVCGVFAPSGEWLAVADSKGNIFQVNLAKNRYKTLARGCNSVTSMCVFPHNAEELAVACNSACIFIYQTTGRLQGTLKGHRTPVFRMEVARGRLISCSKDACVLWRCEDWGRVRSLYGEKNGFVWAGFAGGGKSILTVHTSGEVFQWSLQSFSLEKQYTTTHHPQSFSVLESFLVSASPQLLTIWTPDSPEPLYTLATDVSIKSVQAVVPGKVAVLGETGGVQIVDLKTKQREQMEGLDPPPVAMYTDLKAGKVLLIENTGAARVLSGLIPGNSQSSPSVTLDKPTSVDPNASSEDVNYLSAQDKLELSQLTPSEMRLQDLRSLISKYGEFPDKYRVSIWKSILNLPGNEAAYRELAEKGIHPAYTDLNTRYPIKNHQLFSHLQRTLSALGHFSPVFAEAPSVPGTIFPIITLCGSQELVCFELTLCLYENWLQHWFLHYPNPPIAYLQSVETLLNRIDSQLTGHLQSFGSIISLVLWPLLGNLLTEVLTKEEWVVMMDHLVINWDKPALLMHVVAQFLVYYKPTLMNIRNLDDLKYFLHKQNPVNVVKMMKKAVISMKKPDLNKDLMVQFVRRVPLPTGKYPVFTSFPQFEVQLKADIRSRIRQEAAETLKKQTYLDDLTSHLLELEEKEKQYNAQQAALMQLEQDRRHTEAVESAAILAERKIIDQELRQKRLNQLKKLQETIENSLDSMLKSRKMELVRLEQEIANRREEDRYFVDKKMQEEALAGLEFQSAQKMYELTRTRETEDEQRRLRDQIESWKREQSLRERLLQEQWSLEDQERRLKLEAIKERKIKEMEAIALENDRKKLEMQQMLQDLEREVRTQDVVRERKLRTVREEEAIRTAEAMDTLTKAQTVMQVEEQMQFKTLLAEERRLAERRAKERLEIIEIERRKQLSDMHELQSEIETLQKRQQRIEIQDKLAELRHEQELKTLKEERQTQEMLLRIEEERRIKRQLERDMERKEEELREKTEFQMVLRETEERLLREERSRFEMQRRELKRQQEEEEAAKTNAHNVKMETIIRDRERQLLELTQSRRREQEEMQRSGEMAGVEEGKREAEEEKQRGHSELTPTISVNPRWQSDLGDTDSEKGIDRSRELRINEGRRTEIDRPSYAAPLRPRVDESHSREEDYRPDLSHDTFSINDERRFEKDSQEEMGVSSPSERSLSPGEEGEKIVFHHDSEYRRNARHASSPGSYSNSSSYETGSSQSYSSGISETPPMPDRYESSYTSEAESEGTGSLTGSSMSWTRSDRPSRGEGPVRSSHYY